MSSSSSSSTVDFGALEALYPQGSDYIKAYGWAAIAGTVILGFGHAPAIADLAGAIIDATQDNSTLQTQAVRKLREALLKASPLVGFPRVSPCPSSLFLSHEHPADKLNTRRASTASPSSKRPSASASPPSPAQSRRTSPSAPPSPSRSAAAAERTSSRASTPSTRSASCTA